MFAWIQLQMNIAQIESHVYCMVYHPYVLHNILFIIHEHCICMIIGYYDWFIISYKFHRIQLKYYCHVTQWLSWNIMSAPSCWDACTMFWSKQQIECYDKLQNIQFLVMHIIFFIRIRSKYCLTKAYECMWLVWHTKMPMATSG